MIPRDDGLVGDLRKDYGEYRTGQWQLDVVSSDPRTIQDVFQARKGLVVSVPAKLGTLDLVGGRKCSLRGVPTAFLVYRRPGAEVSLFVFNADHLDRFPRAQEIKDYLVDDKGTIQVVALRSGWKMVCAAGPIPSGELTAICKSLRD